MMWRFKGWLFLLLLVGAAACALPEEERPDESTSSRYALEALDEDGTWELWQWYVVQGIDGCDPPPDPWHPFVRFGYCDAGAEHEMIPNVSYDDQSQD